MNVLFDPGQLLIQRGLPQQLLGPIELHKPIPIGGVY